MARRSEEHSACTPEGRAACLEWHGRESGPVATGHCSAVLGKEPQKLREAASVVWWVGWMSSVPWRNDAWQTPQPFNIHLCFAFCVPVLRAFTTLLLTHLIAITTRSGRLWLFISRGRRGREMNQRSRACTAASEGTRVQPRLWISCSEPHRGSGSQNSPYLQRLCWLTGRE